MAKKKNDKEDKKVQQQKSKSNKKRKVGRPKKRGRKKKYYKPKKKRKATAQARKGFGSNVSYNRVRALLWREFKQDFESYRDFISNRTDEDGNKIKGTSIVSQVYNECKSVDCTDEDILIIYRQFKEQSKGEPPYPLPFDYFIAHPYWELHTENWWDGMDERIWVYSPMLLAPPSTFLGVLGEDRCIDKDGKVVDRKCDPDKGDKEVSGKKDLFLPFINYCNQFQQQGFMEATEEMPHFKFVGKISKDKDGKIVEGEEPYWNTEQGRWEIQIVPCDPFGNINDYGFIPTEPFGDIPDLEDLDVPTEPPLTPEEPEPIDEDLTKVQIEETKKTAKLERLLKKKEDAREDIKLWKEIGDKKEMQDAIKRLKKIQSDIDKLE